VASSDKKRKQVKMRIPNREPAGEAKTRSLGSMGFANDGTRTTTGIYTVMLQSRISEPMALDLAAFGNDNAMGPSETVRHLLEVGLEKEKKRK
jgi:hypothetical protein